MGLLTTRPPLGRAVSSPPPIFETEENSGLDSHRGLDPCAGSQPDQVDRDVPTAGAGDRDAHGGSLCEAAVVLVLAIASEVLEVDGSRRRTLAALPRRVTTTVEPPVWWPRSYCWNCVMIRPFALEGLKQRDERGP